MTRTWYENEDILEQFRGWLTQTNDEIQAWARNADAVSAEPAGQYADEEESEVGLLQLVESWTAMRHELKLQTKGTRGLEDAVQAALKGLESASRQFQSVEADKAQAAQQAAKPLVEALINLDEALERGTQAMLAAQQQAAAADEAQWRQALDERFRQLPAWRRWFGRSWRDQVGELFGEQLQQARARILTPWLEGYQLIRARLARQLDEQQIRRIDCLGRPVDPSKMIVVELVDDPRADPETVVGVTRPGYLWRGFVVRFAEVRAVRRPPADETHQERL